MRSKFDIFYLGMSVGILIVSALFYFSDIVLPKTKEILIEKNYGYYDEKSGLFIIK